MKVGTFIISIALLLCACKTLHCPPPPRPPTAKEMTEESDEKCYYNGALSVKDRRAKYPFNKAYTIKVISFDSYNERAPIANDTIDYSKVFEDVVLSARQIDSLTNILFNYDYSPTTMFTTDVRTGCFAPRQALVFIDKAGKVMAYIEICFECEQVNSNLPRRTYGIFCKGKYHLIKDFFVSLGIKHFTDTGKNPIIEEPEPVIAKPDAH